MPVKVPIPYLPYTKIYQTIRINYKPPVENLFSTPINLPTSEPDTPQFSWTVSQSDLPDIYPQPLLYLYVAFVFLGGKNTSTSSITLYWKMLRNGVVVATGSGSVSAGYYWTLNARYLGIEPNDVLEIKLWTSASGVNYDYKAYQVLVTRLVTAEALNSVCSVYFASMYSQDLYLGNPYYVTSYGIYVYHLDYTIYTNLTSPTSFDILMPKSNYGLFRVYYGDVTGANTATIATSSTYRPYYYRNYVPNVIKLVIWKLW